MPPECEIPEEHTIQIEIHGKWLRLITIVVALANGIGMPGLAYLMHNQPKLLSQECVTHVLESEIYSVRSVNEDCLQAVRESRYRLLRYLQRVEDFKNEIK